MCGPDELVWVPWLARGYKKQCDKIQITPGCPLRGRDKSPFMRGIELRRPSCTATIQLHRDAVICEGWNHALLILSCEPPRTDGHRRFTALVGDGTAPGPVGGAWTEAFNVFA